MGESESFSVEGGEEFLAVRRLVGQLAKSDLVRVSLRDRHDFNNPIIPEPYDSSSVPPLNCESHPAAALILFIP